jgi:hypothetical protein
MKLLVNKTDYDETIKLAKDINQAYDKFVTFHCYWNGTLNEKHLYSIKSCHHFNCGKHKITLWLENNIPNQYNEEIGKYAEIKYFSLEQEINNTVFIQNNNFYYRKTESFYSDLVRYLLLYNYGGCWFDLDIFFLRCFDPIFYNFENEVCVYQWENQNYPNGAIYISLEKNSLKLRKVIEFIISRNRGWGFQEAQLTYDLPLDMLVLPCSWFNGDWIDNPYNIGTEKFFEHTEKKYDFTNFFNGAFCYHWHNKWDKQIQENSIITQLISIINLNINLN